MTYKELQTALKAYRDQGYHITVRLNVSKEVLEMELQRLELLVAEEAVAEEAVAEELPVAAQEAVAAGGGVTIGVNVESYEATERVAAIETYEVNETQVIFIILDDTVSDKVNVACSEETLYKTYSMFVDLTKRHTVTVLSNSRFKFPKFTEGYRIILTTLDANGVSPSSLCYYLYQSELSHEMLKLMLMEFVPDCIARDDEPRAFLTDYSEM